MKLKLLFWLRNLVLLNILIFTALSTVFAQTNSISEFPAGQPIGSITTGPDGALWFPELNTARTAEVIARLSTDGVLTEFLLPARCLIFGITSGPDGAIWFTDVFSRVGRITTTGNVTFYPISDEADDIVTGPDGALWFTESGLNLIGRITTSGSLTEFVVPSAAPPLSNLPPTSDPFGITAGSDGALWFVERRLNQIGRITTDGFFTEYQIPTLLSGATEIAAGPDGALWFTEVDAGVIGRITTGGLISEFPLPGAGPESFIWPTGIARGPDGAMWFTERLTNKIGRITKDGVITEFPVPTEFSDPIGITAGADGAMWFTEERASQIGRIQVQRTLTAPVNVQATQIGITGDKILITWNYPDTQIDDFVIASKFPSGNWVPLATVPPVPSCTPASNTPHAVFCTYFDTNVPPFSTVSYEIHAQQGGTDSPDSIPTTAYQLKICPPASGCEPFVDQSTINAHFTPDPTLMPLASAARDLGFKHFNWVSFVEHYPRCYLTSPDSDKLHMWIADPVFPQVGPSPQAPHIDPPLGGYFEYGIYRDGCTKCDRGPSDALPYYWNEQPQWFLSPTFSLNPEFDLASNSAGGDQTQAPTAKFFDQPHIACLPGDSPTQTSDYLGFLTALVGVDDQIGTLPAKYTVLNAFTWNTTFNSKTGGVSVTSARPPVDGGTGGVFNVVPVNVSNLPPDVRQLLAATGAQNLSTAQYVDSNAPITAGFLSGQQETNGWVRGLLTVTLIATDIDGPADIFSTTYSLDGGPQITYTGPFAIAGDGIHNLEFGSTDIAGNVETPRPSRIVKIDSTPPTITPYLAPSTNANGWTNSDVTVSFACADALSGLAAGSPPTATVLASEGANQQVSGTCFDVAGNSASATVSGINIDKTPPVLSGLPVAGCTLWPPNHKFVTVATISGSDALSGLAALNVTGTSNEPMDPNNPDIIISGSGTQPRTVQLRAERLGTGSGRVYTINTVATDAAGNTVSATSTCTVPHDQGH